MLARTSLRPQIRCLSYCDVLIRAFPPSSSTSNFGVSWSALKKPSKWWTAPPRAFGNFNRLRSDSGAHSSEIAVYKEGALGQNPSSASSVEKDIKTASSLPWYLTVQPPRHFQSPLSDRQRLPDLPPQSPSLLQPMLEHISINLGLDDLSLLDLRPLDPPPALGANLLMIIGTARSEKHLHVSADRFCRWLRTEHKMTPYADGLLGRGELKLKMRRKARRARIMSRVGSAEHGSPDDGLRTGWVCVNVGTIEDGATPADDRSAIEGYVGFGRQSEGTKVVVQMLTEEKREELDLERLWSQALGRQERRKKRIFGATEEAGDAHNQEVDKTLPNIGEPSSNHAPPFH